MPPSSESITPAQPGKIDFRVILGVLLLAAAMVFTWRTIEELSARRTLRTDLAEISHVRYDLLNADRWVQKIIPILNAQIDALDFKAANRASLRPMVVTALNHLLDSVKQQMSTPSPNAAAGGLLGGGIR